ncbi:hypothetical protein KA012_04770 [Candidatus Woesebacteria bacterium]|nr:hypothetical protein [Candidatus Woesebacteria bacterium]
MIKKVIRQQLAAYTLIEILVVATIIIVLTAISVASFSTANKSAKDAKRKSDLETIRQAMVLYKAQEGSYPVAASPGAAAALLITGPGGRSYLSPPAPTDPVSTNPYAGSSDATTFCFCAQLDSTTKGNSGAACSWAATTHYCVRQP